MKLFSRRPAMARPWLSMFLMRYLLPVVCTVVAAPIVVVVKAWPLLRMGILLLAAACMLLVAVSLVAQGV